MSIHTIPEEVKNVILKGEAIGKSGKSRKIIGGSTINNLLTIQGIMEKSRPSKTMEIGMAYGISTLLFALKHKSVHEKPNQQHYTIDPFQISHWDSCGLELLKNAGLSDYVNFSESFSCAQLPKWVDQNIKFDLIYIDGSHLFEDVFIDYYYCAQLLNENGIMLFDDCRDPHVLKVVKFIKNNMGDFFEEEDLNQYAERKGAELFKYKIASRLDKIQLRGFVKKNAANNRNWDSKLGQF